jgi:hypothetical protein
MGVLLCGSSFAINTVRVESKRVDANSTDTIGVYINNDQPLVALTLPLEIRSRDAAAYMDSAAFKWEIIPGGRLDQSPLGPNNPAGPPATPTNRKFAAPSLDSGCVTGPASAKIYSRGYVTSAANPNFISPDAVLLATYSTGIEADGDDIDLDPGEDAPGSPSVRLIFKVNGGPGIFTIDTCCVAPFNHLTFVVKPADSKPVNFEHGIVGIDVDAGVEADGENFVPGSYGVGQNYPNPFNASTVIRFATSTDGNVKLDVFNILGRKVRTLMDEYRAYGTQQAIWDGTNDRGDVVATGVYFYRIQTAEFNITRKMVLLK